MVDCGWWLATDPVSISRRWRRILDPGIPAYRQSMPPHQERHGDSQTGGSRHTCPGSRRWYRRAPSGFRQRSAHIFQSRRCGGIARLLSRGNRGKRRDLSSARPATPGRPTPPGQSSDTNYLLDNEIARAVCRLYLSLRVPARLGTGSRTCHALRIAHYPASGPSRHGGPLRCILLDPGFAATHCKSCPCCARQSRPVSPPASPQKSNEPRHRFVRVRGSNSGPMDEAFAPSR